MVTKAEYSGLERAFTFFNKKLFDGNLPPVLITFRKHGRAFGYFGPNRYGQREGKEIVHELALNTDLFEGRSDEEILSTLAHESTHCWQHVFGHPSRNGYHNKEWGSAMKAIGLHPSDTGLPGGRETGQRMSHYIVKGGRFQVACRELLKSGFALHWQSRDRTKEKAPNSKVKFSCPTCMQNAWAKPEAKLICGVCYGTDEIAKPMAAEK